MEIFSDNLHFDYITIITSFSFILGLCSVYGTPALVRVSGFVLYTELPPFKG